jgi:hypothetical protein
MDFLLNVPMSLIKRSSRVAIIPDRCRIQRNGSQRKLSNLFSCSMLSVSVRAEHMTSHTRLGKQV